MKEQNMNETTEMTTTSGFSGLSSMEFLAEAMNDDCMGLEFSLDRIKIPAGGMTAFEVPAGDGETTELQKEIECVILLSHPANAYYHDIYKGGSNPPDCSSFDGVTGSTGARCRTCPYNQFGSGQGGGKACKNRRMLYLLRENEVFPLVLNLPTGSLRTFTKYVQSLLTMHKRPHQVVTRISLRKASSSSSIEYSQAVFRYVRMLTPEEQTGIDSMVSQVRGIAAGMNASAMTPVDDADNPFDGSGTGESVQSLE